ncbi:hypothetical protein J1614_005881 [Plenodomus biglobosus]|nr:hypothetical protein J1614_005881 [Plenodomus biglobosus]
MNSTSESCLQALLALSGNPLLANVRQNLIQDISDRDLSEVIMQGAWQEFSRQGLEQIAIKLLDMINRGRTVAHGNEDIAGLFHGLERNHAQMDVDSSSDLSHNAAPNPNSETAERPNQIDPSKRQAAYPISAPRPNGQGRSPYELTESSIEHSLASRPTESNLMHLSSTVESAKKDFPEDEKRRTHSSMASDPRQLDDENRMPGDIMVLWQPTIYDEGLWIPLKDLPPRLKTLMTDSFEDAYLLMSSRAIKLNQILRNLDGHLRHGNCLNQKINKRQKGPCAHSQAEGNLERACDYCIKMHRICIRPMDVDGVMRLALYPLPETLRYGKNFEDIEYWISQ